MPSVVIRAMSSPDVQAVSALCAQLGYESCESDIRRRFSALAGSPDNALFVALDGSHVVGWAHVGGVARLQTDGYAEIGGIVVAERSRRRGIGAQLMAECEKWSARAGYRRLRLRSGFQRPGAHVFYERIGYTKGRGSFAFERII